VFFKGNHTHISHISGVSNDFKESAEPFIKIGSKYYMIEKQYPINWFAAAMKCREMGGNLGNVQSNEDLQALDLYLDKSKRYWLDLTDLAEESKFRSLTTGKLKDTYPLWNSGEPNNLKNAEHCAHLMYNDNRYVINDYACNKEYLYICETNYPRTISIVTW